MKIHILSLFPEMFQGPLDYSIVKRARDAGLVEVFFYNIRDWATDNYKSVDDRPYGGGPGMVMRVDVLDAAISDIKSRTSGETFQSILMDAGGETFVQKTAVGLVKFENLLFVCGHYEGVDYRVHEHLVDKVISVGNYVLSGGEIPAMTIIDTVVRLIPGALGNNDSLVEESHTDESIEYPQYTRPAEYKNWKVPEVLLQGNHKDISAWRKEKSANRS